MCRAGSHPDSYRTYVPRQFAEPQYCNPAEEIRIRRNLGSHQSVAAHGGDFQFKHEGRAVPRR
jgi:hypothetical protein